MSSNSNTIITKEMASPKHIREIYKDFIKDKPKEERAKLMKILGTKLKDKTQGQRKRLYRIIMEEYGGWEKCVKKEDDEESVSSFGDKEDELSEIDDKPFLFNAEYESLKLIDHRLDQPTTPFSESCDETSEEELEVVEHEDTSDEEMERVRKSEDNWIVHYTWIEGIPLSEAVFSTLPDDAKKSIIDEALRVKELETKTSKFTHKRRKGSDRKTANGSNTENYDIWNYLYKRNSQKPSYFIHTLTNEAGVKDMWYMEYNNDYDHYCINWEKSKTNIPKTQLSWPTLLTTNENHKKLVHKFNSMTFGECFNKKKGPLKGKPDFKALSKVCFQLPDMTTGKEKLYDEYKEWVNKEKIRKEEEKEKKEEDKKKKTTKKTKKTK